MIKIIMKIMDKISFVEPLYITALQGVITMAIKYKTYEKYRDREIYFMMVCV